MRTYLSLFTGVLFASALFACGGGQAPKKSRKETCKDQVVDFTMDGDVCNPVTIEQVEVNIKNWQQTCSRYATLDEKNHLSEFLTRSQKCSDEVRAVNARRDQCSARIREMGTLDCLGKRCERALDDAKELMDECEQYEYTDDTMILAKRLVPHFEQRIVDNQVTLAFSALSKECTETGAIIAEGHADEKVLLNLLLEKIRTQDRIEVTREKGSQIEAARILAVSSCSATLTPAVKTFVDQASGELDNKRTKRKPDVWLNHYTAVEKLYLDLQAVRGETVFPEPTAAAKKVLNEFKGLAEKLEGEASKKISSKTLRSINKDVNQCKKLIKKAAQFRAKVLSHQASGNEKKASAYQAKVDKTTDTIMGLQSTFQKILNREDLTQKDKQRLKEDLLKSQCLDAKIVEASE